MKIKVMRYFSNGLKKFEFELMSVDVKGAACILKSTHPVLIKK